MVEKRANRFEQQMFGEALTEVVTEDIKRKQKQKPKDSNSYNRFYAGLIEQVDIDELVAEGGAESVENFKETLEKKIKDRGYYDVMFESKFVGKDGQTRKSKFNRLGKAIYDEKIAPLKDGRVDQVEYSRQGKTQKFYYQRLRVKSGERIDFGKKTYKGGQFLPKDFRIGK